jgi:glycosyltransferase involved in cell wall biosynthesis
MNRVLIFNHFGSVMHRGIPLYAQDIAESMRRVGLRPIELRCPRFLSRAPRWIRNLLFVLFEQLVAPAARVICRCKVAVYPYNSAGIIDALLGRSILVVHDLISNERRGRSLSARYVTATQTIHRRLGRPVCAASELTFAQLRRLAAFAKCPLELWSNPFYSFEAALAERRRQGRHDAPQECLRVLLCSGMGPNKDYAGAIRLFAASRVLRDAELHVIGFGRDADLARRRLHRLPPRVAERITVHPGLTLEALVDQYLAADIVWVHSRDEGFGRCVIEAKLTGRPVVASDINAFRRQRGVGVYLYEDSRFEAAFADAIDLRASVPMSSAEYHAPLEHAVARVLSQYVQVPASSLLEEKSTAGAEDSSIEEAA